MISASITKRNNPSVKAVTGMVNSTRRGFTNTFKTAITRAMPIADQKLFTETPGNTHAVRYTAKAEIKRFAISDIIFLFFNKNLGQQKLIHHQQTSE